MHILQVEELEPRQLLNGTSFFPSPAPPPADPAGSVQVFDHAPAASSGDGAARSVGRDRFPAGDAGFDSARSWADPALADHTDPLQAAACAPFGRDGAIDAGLVAPNRFPEGYANEVKTPVLQSDTPPSVPRPVVVPPAPQASSYQVYGTAVPETGSVIVIIVVEVAPASTSLDVASAPDPSRTRTGEITVTLPAAARSSPETTAAVTTTVAAASARPGPGAQAVESAAAAAAGVPGAPAERPQLLPLRSENPVGVPSARVEAQGLAAVPARVGTVSQGEKLPSVPDGLGQRFQHSTSRLGPTPPTAPDEEHAEAGVVRSFPEVSGALSVLPPFDLSILERGMRQFLEQVEETGSALAWPEDGTGLGVWVVAGATAAVACEIARRQLKRPAVVPAVAGCRLPGTPPGPFLAG
jgi:hypothetical protein